MISKVVPKNAILIPESATCVFRGKIYDVYQWQQKMFDGTFQTFEMLRRPDTVVVCAILDDKVVMISDEQPNRPAEKGLPGGRVDAGETWEQAAVRELREETGYLFRNFKLVHVAQPVAKIEWFVSLYIATDCEVKGELKLDTGEKIDVFTVTLEELKSMALDRRVKDLLPLATQIATAQSLQELAELEEFSGMPIKRDN